MLRTFTLGILILLFTSARAQNPFDSLHLLLRNNPSPNRLPVILAHLAWHHLQARANDSAVYYYHRSLTASDHSDLVLEASAFNGLGVAFNYKGDMDSSIYYYQQALLLYEKTGDRTNQTNVATNLSIIYKNKGLYEESLEVAFAALSQLETLPPDRPLASCYSTIGSVYTSLLEFDRALEFHHHALTIRQQINYSRGIGQSFNNLGEVFLLQKRWDSAAYYFKKAIQLKTEIGDPTAVTYNNLGETYFSSNPATARQHFESALQQHQQAGDKGGIIRTSLNLSRWHATYGLTSTALEYANKAETLARQSGALELLKQALDQKLQLYQSGNPAEALQTSRELLLIKDSLLNIDKANTISNLQIRYETARREQQIEMLQQAQALQQAQLQTSQTWTLFLSISIVLLSALILVIFFQFRATRRNKKRIELLLQELNHRVKNNLQILASLLTLQSEHTQDPNLASVIKSSEGRVNAMALIHKKLSTEQNGQVINLKDYIPELLSYLLQSYDFNSKGGTLHLDIQELKVPVDKAIPIALIINELVSNACKYAWPNHSSPELSLSTQSDHQYLTIRIADNGIGTPQSFNHQSFGLKMVEMLIRELNARWEQTSNNGTQYRIVIPNQWKQ